MESDVRGGDGAAGGGGEGLLTVPSQQKGSVENLVGWVKGTFLKTRQFLDVADLQMQLQAWHEEVSEFRTPVLPASESFWGGEGSRAVDDDDP